MKYFIYQSKIFIWVFIYTLYVYIAFNVWGGSKDLQSILSEALFAPQKYYFDATLFFTAYIFVLKKPFVSAQYVTRCKSAYFFNILFYGIKICSFYLIYTFILFFGCSILNSYSIHLNSMILLNILNFASFIISLYLLYLLFLLLFENQIVGVLAGVVININIMVILFLINEINENYYTTVSKIIMAVYPGVAIALVLCNAYLYRRKEFFK